MTDLTLHFVLFVVAASLMVAAPMIIGFFVRPFLPTPEKEAVYECGEPAIGSSYIQFDIRFYVVALLFILFDVEVAFFFPWATVFGGAAQLADPALSEAARLNLTEKLLNLQPGTATPRLAIAPEDALRMAWVGFADIAVFFGVLLVGFAYVWKRGDLDWVRAMAQKAKEAQTRPRQPTVLERTAERQLVP